MEVKWFLYIIAILPRAYGVRWIKRTILQTATAEPHLSYSEPPIARFLCLPITRGNINEGGCVFLSFAYVVLQPSSQGTPWGSCYWCRKGLVAQGCGDFSPTSATSVPPEPQAIRWIFAMNMARAMNYRLQGSPSHSGLMFYFWQPLLENIH